MTRSKKSAKAKAKGGIKKRGGYTPEQQGGKVRPPKQSGSGESKPKK